MPDTQVLVHIVHGTFDAREPDVPHWANTDGLLAQGTRKHLPKELGERVKFEPLDWSGVNSFPARADGAAKLAGALRTGDPPLRLLIGHSHGGTVIADALLGASQANVAGALTMATPFVARTSNRGGGVVVAAVAPVLAVWVALAGAVSFAIHQWWIAAASCLVAMVLGLVGFSSGRAGCLGAVCSAIAVLLVPFAFTALWFLDSSLFGTFVAMLLAVAFLLLYTARWWTEWPLVKKRGWEGLPAETEVPGAPAVPLLALRLPGDEASFAIVTAQAVVWLETRNLSGLVARIGRRLRSFLEEKPWLGAAILGTSFCGVAALVKQPDAGWWIVPLHGLVLMVTSTIALAIAVSVFLLWMKVLTTLLLAAAVGLELREGLGAVGVYAEPLPRWSSHANCRLEILHWTEADLAAMPELRHSMHRLDVVHQRIAKWIEERMAVVDAAPAPVSESRAP